LSFSRNSEILESLKLIEAYSFGHLWVDGNEYTSDAIIGPKGVKAGWWRRQSHVLRPEDLALALAMEPTVLVVGKGKFGLMRVPEETRQFLEERDIRLVVQRTSRAWRTFNRLASSGDRVVAALHIFC
jgi:hypothetical protein